MAFRSDNVEKTPSVNEVAVGTWINCVTIIRLRINPIINAIRRLRRRIKSLKRTPGFSASNGSVNEIDDEDANRLVDVADCDGIEIVSSK